MLSRPELRIDKLYRNTNNWKNQHDIFNLMFRNFSDGLGIQNVGGFRFKSKINQSKGIINAAFVLLVTSFAEHEWPDNLDLANGIFTYYGDNREPGKSIEDTRIGGNRFLAHIFSNIHNNSRELVPPLLCFESIKDRYSYMKFLGLAAPGANNLSSLEDLTAVWRFQSGKRFQNYKAMFTILKVETIDWSWMDDLVAGVLPFESRHCPNSWYQWVKSGIYQPLVCLEKKTPRNVEQQMPQNFMEQKILDMLFEINDREFEFAAKRILELIDNSFKNCEVTPRFKDGGRDILGLYEIGHSRHKVSLDVIVEAKQWKQARVGVKPMARLISRLKHRDIGVFITTSVFDKAVQQELIDDKHPIILISGGDIARILIANEIYGYGYEHKLADWLSQIKAEAEI